MIRRNAPGVIKMDENILAKDEIPGTAKIKRIASELTPIELLEVCARVAKEGLDKKLWSILSRVYENGKSFDYKLEEGMEGYVETVLNSSVSSELKLQLFTSFKLPLELKPDEETVKQWLDQCDKKRINIAAYFVAEYEYEQAFYKDIISKKEMFKIVTKSISGERLVGFYKTIIANESKEVITGVIRFLEEQKVKVDCKDSKLLKELTDVVFESREVFFTTKLQYCISFNVPFEYLPYGRDLDKLLKISINYEERVTKEFVKKYNLKFDISDAALCRYYIGNKKATKEKPLVTKFAAHVVRVEDEETKRKLLRGAFKRGGYFRMYAGCMQDGKIDVDKLHRFKYTDEDIEWCRNLAGFNK